MTRVVDPHEQLEGHAGTGHAGVVEEGDVDVMVVMVEDDVRVTGKVLLGIGVAFRVYT